MLFEIARRPNLVQSRNDKNTEHMRSGRATGGPNNYPKHAHQFALAAQAVARELWNY